MLQQYPLRTNLARFRLTQLKLQLFYSLSNSPIKVIRVAPILKPILAPLVRQGLQAAATAGTQKLGEKNKFLGDIASTVAPQLIDAAATKAGFGMKGKRSTDKLQDDRSVFLNPDHPANSPVVPYISGNRGGKGFRPSGY